MSHSTRRFDRMFPGITQEENRFTRDLLADGRLAAERNRRIRQDQSYLEMQAQKENTLEALLNILCIREYDKTKNIEYRYEPEKKENWDIIIDHKNKCIKFIDKKSWEFIYKEFE